MQRYFFVLGSTPVLSFFELSQVINSQSLTEMKYGIAAAELESDVQAQELMNILGGTVKILRSLEEITTDQATELHTKLLSHLEAEEAAKVVFAISTVGITNNEPLDIDIGRLKKDLLAVGKKVRYIESKSGGLSAAVLLHQSVTELNVIKTDTGYAIGKTVAVQDIDDWTNRDRSKPYADSKKGMLPPKVARIMVNSALGLFAQQDPDVAPTLYDPFCGSGTVLMEALMRGLSVAGSDLDMTAVEGTKANIAWLEQEYGISGDVTVVYGDATQPVLPATIHPHLLVTEPFLGKPNPKLPELPNVFKGLHKMYLGAFKNWTRFLADGAVVCIVMPLVETPEKRFSLESLIDKLSELGYTTISEPIVYRRPQAVVQRQVHFLRYKGQ